MEHTNEMERWRLEIELDRLQTELAEARLVLARVDELHHLLQGANATDDERWRAIGKALLRLSETYTTWARNRYPDGRP